MGGSHRRSGRVEEEGAVVVGVGVVGVVVGLGGGVGVGGGGWGWVRGVVIVRVVVVVDACDAVIPGGCSVVPHTPSLVHVIGQVAWRGGGVGGHEVTAVADVALLLLLHAPTVVGVERRVGPLGRERVADPTPDVLQGGVVLPPPTTLPIPPYPSPSLSPPLH